jgi:hypothetical protein
MRVHSRVGVPGRRLATTHTIVNIIGISSTVSFPAEYRITFNFAILPLEWPHERPNPTDPQ